jgi:hypothetical protein
VSEEWISTRRATRRTASASSGSPSRSSRRAIASCRRRGRTRSRPSPTISASPARRQGDEIQAVAQALVAFKDLVNKLGSDNLALDQPGSATPPVHGVDARSSYLFNATVPGFEHADAILLVGTNPRHEAAVLDSRIRKSWLHTPLEVGFVGERADTTYGYEFLGTDARALADFVAGKREFAKKFANAKKPLIIVRSAGAEHADGAAVDHALAKYAEKNKDKLLTPGWNGLSVLQRVRPLPRGARACSRSPRRPRRVRRRTTWASYRRARPRARRASSCICQTRTSSTRRRSRRTRSSSTRATTATSARPAINAPTPAGRAHGTA